MDEKIGLAIFTYNRPEYLKQVLSSVRGVEADYLKVFIDYHSEEMQKELAHICEVYDIDYFKSSSNKGIGRMKNEALHEMQLHEVDHLFLMEDDILIKDLDVLKAYINYAEKKGVEHLNFAHHGPANKDLYCIYKDSICYPNVVGAFSYYTKNCIETVGYFDEDYLNAYEHVDHTERIANAGLTYPFWYFADCYGSQSLLEEIPGSIDNSSIRPRSDWQSNILKAQKISFEKKGYYLPPKPKNYQVYHGV